MQPLSKLQWLFLHKWKFICNCKGRTPKTILKKNKVRGLKFSISKLTQGSSDQQYGAGIRIDNRDQWNRREQK